MSFSSQVKKEIASHCGSTREACLAELAALLECCGRIRLNVPEIRIQVENEIVIKKVFTLLKKTFNITMEVRERQNQNGSLRKCGEGILRDPEQVRQVLEAVGFLRLEEGRYRFVTEPKGTLLDDPDPRRAYIRGAFLGSGSITDPEKTYHIEFVGETLSYAQRLQGLLETFGVASRILERKRSESKTTFVLYLKDGEQIVDVLNIMEAHVALMDLENIRILKEMRNQVNRQVNCETANLNKTVEAAVKQVEDIEYLKEQGQLELLPESLREMAQIRLEHPQDPLGDLGRWLSPPIGKSGVNHRLRKLSQCADELRRKTSKKEQSDD
jgi:hypothetical protein